MAYTHSPSLYIVKKAATTAATGRDTLRYFKDVTRLTF